MHKNMLQWGTLSIFLLSCSSQAFAAQAVSLDHRSPAMLTSFSLAPTPTSLSEVTREVDFNHTLHVRFQQTYMGYPVWGGEGAVHINNGNKNQPLMMLGKTQSPGFMNGKIYQGLKEDLNVAPHYVLTDSQKQKALQHVIDVYQKSIGAHPKVEDSSITTLVYLDKEQKAHWAFKIQFNAAPHKSRGLPERPVYIIDATTLEVYKHWNDIKTLDPVKAGGYGGNRKTGRKTYDGMGSNLPALEVERDASAKLCYLQNQDVSVHDASKGEEVMHFNCSTIDNQHQVYWNGDQDAKNGAYSPSNDALYEGAVIKDMYQKWYGVPVLIENGKPMMLRMVVHEAMENAYWDGKKMVFGDGDGFLMFYPLTSLDVAAHEISHGFTEQHSNLTYEGQSGGMNESFSDMAAQAAFYFSRGKATWKIGEEITLWLLGDALRYMDMPSRDCKSGKQPGDQCSIDSADQYNDKIDVHFSSGVYNRFFYLLSTSAGWNPKKAFDVMVQANRYYWTANSTFQDAACGTIHAAKDYKYDLKSVKRAFSQIGIKTGKC